MKHDQDDAGEWLEPEQEPDEQPARAVLVGLAVAVPRWALTPLEPATQRVLRASPKATTGGKRKRFACGGKYGCGRKFRALDEFLYHPCTSLRFTVVVLWDFQLTAPDQEGRRRRKCSPFPRARSTNMGKLSLRARQAAITPSLFDVDVQKLRPKTRADCKDGPRPCPWIGCRYNQAITVNPENGSIKENFPHLRIVDEPDGPGLLALEAMVGTCALDACDDADDGTEGVAGLLALYQAATSGQPIGITAGLTLDETRVKFGLSVERIRQLGAKAMQEMRVALRRLEGAQQPPLKRKAKT